MPDKDIVLLKDTKNIQNTMDHLLNTRWIPEKNLEYFHNMWSIKVMLWKVVINMRDLEWNITGTKDRKIDGTKSVNKKWSNVSYLYSELDFDKPINILEWEIDLLTVASPWSNCIWLLWVQWLTQLVQDLKEKWVPRINLLIDNDKPADKAIQNMVNEDIDITTIYDCRQTFAGSKDVNEYISKWETIDFDDIDKQWILISELIKKEVPFIAPEDSLCIYNKKWIAQFIDEEAIARRIIKDEIILWDNWTLFVFSNDSRLWSNINDKKMWKIIIDYINLANTELKKEGKDKTPKVCNRGKKSILDFIKDISESKDTKKLYNAHYNRDIVLEDKILNLDTREYRECTKEDYRMNKLPYHSKILNGEGNISTTKWDKFLNDILEWYNKPQEIKDFLQEYVWYMFLASPQFEKALLLYWTWANGKWVLLETIMALLWKKNYSAIWMHELLKDQNLNLLIWKLVNVDADMQQGVKIDSGNIKKLISWEPITGKAVYKIPENFHPMARWIMATNELPIVWSIDDSIVRRFVFLELKNSFREREDFNLKKDLQKELDWIFVWAIDWLKRLVARNKFNIPSEIQDVVGNFIEEQDTVKEFIETTTEYKRCDPKDTNCYVTVNNLYKDYYAFCISLKERAIDRAVFSKRLKSLWFKLKKVKNQRAILWLHAV